MLVGETNTYIANITSSITYDVMLAIYVFFSPTNNERQNIRYIRKDFLTEEGKSIQSPMFVFNVNYNRKIGKRTYTYK